MTTPSDLNIKKGTYIAPKGGWDAQTHYIVDAAFTSGNPIKRYVFYSGFISDGLPSGYNCLFSHSTVNDKPSLFNMYYLKAIKRIEL